jgi:hypothetical protein
MPAIKERELVKIRHEWVWRVASPLWGGLSDFEFLVARAAGATSMSRVL